MTTIDELEKSDRISYSLDEFAAATGLSKESIRLEVEASNIAVSYAGAQRTKPLIGRAEGIRWFKSLPNEKRGRAA